MTELDVLPGGLVLLMRNMGRPETAVCVSLAISVLDEQYEYLVRSDLNECLVYLVLLE